ncbi:hypothetical protein HZ326_8813 [Fusarium oxysporum f. sp. albedinis]|nr:hypothetical protein HZ326_8813 [Fusarium oxysporum f. sp. albedinis]
MVSGTEINTRLSYKIFKLEPNWISQEAYRDIVTLKYRHGRTSVFFLVQHLPHSPIRIDMSQFFDRDAVYESQYTAAVR